jgi:hypothetical protein
MARFASEHDRHHRNSRQEPKMKILLEKLGLIRPAPKAAPQGCHMSPWHPLFYKAVSFHIIETTSIRRNIHR